MKILLVYPEYPETFWSFKHALKFISKKAGFPPLGLLTVAALLPKDWQKKLIDLSTAKLDDQDILWADYVFISAMSIQKDSAKKIIARCNKLGIKIVAGGPLFTANFKDYPEVGHFILNEAEITLPLFLRDLKNGQAKRIYKSDQAADMTKTPIPQWSLIRPNKYASMSIQYSRGCPYNCEFCNVTSLFGRNIRTKTKMQMLAELEEIYKLGWRGNVFMVDDNFIGNKLELRKEILPAMIDWMGKKKYPFSFNTQSSINLADDEELMRLMIEAGFDSVFIGVETPDEASLAECNKMQNKNRDLIACIKKIQNFGLQVQAGFIVGFDSDQPTIFERMIKFIQASGIVTAMVGLLNAPTGTRLYQRLIKEKRLLREMTGDNTDLSLNFIPKMDREMLLAGYKKILKTIYSPKQYYQRILLLLRNYKSSAKKNISQFHFYHLRAFIKSIFLLGIIHQGRSYYWKLLFWSLIRRPKLLPLAVTLAIHGYHFRKIFSDY